MHFILFQVWLRDTSSTGVSAGVGVEGENIKEGDDSREGYMQKQEAQDEADVLWG
jgi:lipid-binding SYLF domain-containing protein